MKSGGAGGARTRDLLTASLQVCLFPVVFEAKLLFCAYPYFEAKKLYFMFDYKRIIAILLPFFSYDLENTVSKNSALVWAWDLTGCPEQLLGFGCLWEVRSQTAILCNEVTKQAVVTLTEQKWLLLPDTVNEAADSLVRCQGDWMALLCLITREYLYLLKKPNYSKKGLTIHIRGSSIPFDSYWKLAWMMRLESQSVSRWSRAL